MISRREFISALALPYPAAPAQDDLPAQFANPPAGFGPVPFWWWTGEPLNKERLFWQLRQLKEKGVTAVNVNYHHDPSGNTDLGDPPLFSEKWWELWRDVVAESKRLGMSIGFDDYTLTWPGRGLIPEMILKEDPQMAGMRLVDEGGAGIVIRREGIDPTHPDIGRKVIEKYFEPFERNTPGEMGKTVNFFFQDELMFGGSMPVWSSRLAEEFKKRKGYDLEPLLHALFRDAGPETTKIRLDYSDVAVALMEESYFRPIYEWHAARGVTYGCDQASRGQVVAGARLYGDYFRAMRWFSAPGNDDPGPGERRGLAKAKVNSSIAHLYERPRTWLEGYHSSGWGVTPADVIAFTNENYVFGMNLLNLHGLYYTTYGGWFEWAPPDFHFRQPYWEHMGAFSGYIARLSFLLTRGVHRADVAIVYPSAAAEAGVEAERAEKDAFGLGGYLTGCGIDFDFIDHQSLERAEVRDRELRVAGEAYRVLLLPSMAVVRHSTMKKALEFHRGGGVVIAYGLLPSESDGDISGMAKEVFGTGRYVREGYEVVRGVINQSIERDFIPSREDVYVLHRRIGARDLYLVYNTRGEPLELEAVFRAQGKAEFWDAWTGKIEPAPALRQEARGTRMRLALEGREARLVVFAPGTPQVQRATVAPRPSRVQTLGGEWEFALQPTMDNRYGDFRLPASQSLVGAEARRFRYAEETSYNPGWEAPALNDSGWRDVTYSFGPRFWTRGPLPPGFDTKEQLIDPRTWKLYDFSLRWGIERDPLLMDRLTGPHGLKRQVPEEFLDLGQGEPGTVWYASFLVNEPQGGPARLAVGSRAQYTAWVNGIEQLTQERSYPVERMGPWRLPVYKTPLLTKQVALSPGVNLVTLRLVQPEAQRLRAFAFLCREDVPAATESLALRWFSSPGTLLPDPTPGKTQPVGWYRFVAPPGLRGMRIVAQGRIRVWVDGVEADVREFPLGADGAQPYQVIVTRPSERSVMAAIRVEQERGCYAGAAFPEPVSLECGPGKAPIGDWSQSGLETYSGAAWYRKRVVLGGIGARTVLDLGSVFATAAVWVNGKQAGVCIAPPWRVDVTPLVRSGENLIEIQVANTLANHYSVGIPSLYVFPGQTRSGLSGPVRLLSY